MRGVVVSGDNTEATYQGVTVLVIDDSNTIRRTAEALLAKAGCSVITATDGFEALAKITDYHPDIIFVDIMMPRLDGYQTCALIKKNPKYKHIPEYIQMYHQLMGIKPKPSVRKIKGPTIQIIETVTENGRFD